MLLWLALACAPPTATLSLSEDVPTVVTAVWDDPTGAWPQATLCTREGDCFTLEGQDDDGLRSAIFVGAPPDTDVAVRIGESDETTSITTGAAPDWVDAEPEVTGQGLPAPFFVTSFNGVEVSGAVVVNAQGLPVWWHAAGEHYVARARLAPDGQSVTYLAFQLLLGNEDYDEADAELVRVSLTGEELERTSLPGAHHDYVEQGDEVAYIRFAVEERLGESWVGDELVALDADGSETVLLSAWDAFDFEEDAAHPETYWSLANHLDAHDDGWVLGFRSLDTFVTLDSSGGVTQALGNASIATPLDDPFTQQHGMHPTEDGWVVFDNGHDDGARLLAFDDDARVTAAFSPDPAVLTPVLGDVVVVDGTWVSSWGLGRSLRQTTPDGDLLTTIQYDTPVLALGFLEPLDAAPGQ